MVINQSGHFSQYACIHVNQNESKFNYGPIVNRSERDGYREGNMDSDRDRDSDGDMVIDVDVDDRSNSWLKSIDVKCVQSMIVVSQCGCLGTIEVDMSRLEVLICDQNAQLARCKQLLLFVNTMTPPFIMSNR